MKKIFIILIIICLPLSVFANEMNMKVSEAENEIRSCASKNLKYSSEITLNSELLDELVYKAIEKKKEYSGDNLESYKKPETNVMLNVSGDTKIITINIQKEIKEYESFIDNVILNVNGMYCYIRPVEISQQANGAENIKLTVNDSQNTIAVYNGTASINTAKIIAVALIAVIAVYITFFLFFAVKKAEFREGFSKKKIYAAGIIIVVICFCYGGALFFTDLSSFAEENRIKITENNTPVFDISYEKANNSNEIKGVYIGLPLYGEDFSPEYTAVWLKSDDNSESDRVIGGNYNNVFDVMKFPVSKNGKYYMKNNKREFDDVNSDNTDLYEAVAVLAAKNILNGKTEGIYGIDDTVTRGEAVTMFSKLLYLKNSKSNTDNFEDVSSSDWYFDYVMAGRENNILSGYDNNTFRAGNTMTRQEFVSVIGQIMENRLGYTVSDDYDNLSVYDDNETISFWAKKYVSLLEKENMNIWSDKYEPSKSITRGEAAILLYRCYILIK